MSNSTEKSLHNLIFEGMKHCGKSSHGRSLAHSLGWAFCDTDDLIVNGFSKQMDEHFTIRQVYELIGEEKFLKLEEGIISGLEEKIAQTGKRFVIALGGRGPVNPHNQQTVKRLGKVVYLKVPADVLYQRSIKRGPLPFLDPTRPEEHFTELYQQREPAYMECADLVIPFSDLSFHEANRLICDKINEAFGDWIKSN